VVAGDGVARQISRQFVIAPYVRDPIGPVGVVRAGDIVEIDKRVVFGRVGIRRRQGNVGPADVFLVGLPGDARILQLRYEVARRLLVVDGGVAVVQDAEVCSGFEPEVVRFAGMVAGGRGRRQGHALRRYAGRA